MSKPASEPQSVTVANRRVGQRNKQASWLSIRAGLKFQVGMETDWQSPNWTAEIRSPVFATRVRSGIMSWYDTSFETKFSYGNVQDTNSAETHDSSAVYCRGLLCLCH